MILIADSGSTKTHWWLVRSGQLQASLVTQGLNPFFYTPKGMAAKLAVELQPLLGEGHAVPEGVREGVRESPAVRAVHFYGAGCSTPGNRQMVRDTLKPLLPGDPEITVETDMLGAARALFGREPGIACILGTGSNACVYDGTDTPHVVPSLGYILGDEGSGAHLGKTFLSRLLKNQLPREVKQAFAQAHNPDRAQLLEEIYHKEHPNRFLASFSEFIHQQMHHPGIVNLLEECFGAFFTEQVCRLPGYQSFSMGCVGSVGYHYRDIIRRLAPGYGIQSVKFMASPMEGLLAYHTTG